MIAGNQNITDEAVRPPRIPTIVAMLSVSTAMLVHRLRHSVVLNICSVRLTVMFALPDAASRSCAHDLEAGCNATGRTKNTLSKSTNES